MISAVYDAATEVADTAMDLAGNVISGGLQINQAATDAINSRIAHEIMMRQSQHESMMRQKFPHHGVSSQYNPYAHRGYIPMVQDTPAQAAIAEAAAEAQAVANMSLNSSSSSIHPTLAIEDQAPGAKAKPKRAKKQQTTAWTQIRSGGRIVKTTQDPDKVYDKSATVFPQRKKKK